MFQSQKIKLLRETAAFFEREGFYCRYKKGTTDHRKFWDREEDRCLYGYEVEGLYIPGYFYHHLNYGRMEVTRKVERVVRGERITFNERIENFPDFWDYDYEYFNAIQDCEKFGKFTSVLKARTKGYSYKAGSMLVRNYHFIPGSKGYAIAFEKEFLVKDGILTKAWNTMDFMDLHTDFTKQRQKKNDLMHRRASYIDPKTGIEEGYKSEIIGISVRHDPDKIRGKRGKLILLEEGGNFPMLTKTWNILTDSMVEGDMVFGVMVAYGTGGSPDADFDGLKKIFFNPKAYNCLEIPYTWDDIYDKPTGFFVPVYMNHGTFMDDAGNSQIDKAIEYEKAKRLNLEEQAETTADLDQYIAEHPFNPFEAVLQVFGNIFPKKLLLEQQLELETNKHKAQAGQVGELYFENKKIVWKGNRSLKAITDFPLPNNKNATGAIVIYEHPELDKNGLVPRYLYIAGADSYDYDSSNTDSLGSILIYKRFYKPGHEHNLIVAEYTGRPDTAEQFYENCRMLLLYYNAVMMYENQNIGIEKYFIHKKSVHLLAPAPSLKNIIKNSRVERKYGVHMPSEVIGYGERLIKNYLQVNDGDTYNYKKIFSIALVKELIAYNPKGNFDRVRAFMCVLIYNEELIDIEAKPQRDIGENYFPKRLFQNNRKMAFK